MPWADEVAAIVEGWYPGGEDGHITAAVLFGDVNPSGKLPITFPASDAQGPATTPERYPGIDGKAYYDEELEVGYRWYQANRERPLFPFGFGLSYTTFSLDGMSVSRDRIEPGAELEIELALSNTGPRSGAEVIQVYVAYPDGLGECAMAVWSTDTNAWVVHPGIYTIYVGTSSADTPLAATVTVE